MSPSKKKHASVSQDDESYLSPQKKRMLKSEAEEMDTSEIQGSQASTVLFELEGNNLNSTNNHGNTNEMKVERNQHEENHISNNDAEANDVNCKASNKDAEENEVDSKVPLSILSDLNDTTINEDTPSKKKKKKKKKHRELDDTVLENASEHITEDALTENDGENAVEQENSTEAKKKKKKKKRKGDTSAEALLDDDHLNNETGIEDEEEIDIEMSFEDTKRMFEDIQKKLMSNKNIVSKTFWDEYRLHPYSSKNCKMAFEKIMSKVQKRRTMLELVSAAGKMMENMHTRTTAIVNFHRPSTWKICGMMFCEKNFKLLKPVTPFKLFSQNHYKKVSEKHPEYKAIQVLNKLTKKWGKLSDQKRLKYIDLALSKKHEYMEDVKDYQKIDSSFVAKPILSRAEWQIKDRCAGLPDVPPRNGFYLFIHKSSELYSNLSHKERSKKLSADFKLLPAEVKEKYNSQVKEEKKNYDMLLKTYLDSLSASDLEDRNLSNKAKKTKTHESHEKPISNFLVNKPPMSGYMLFFRELKEELKGVPVIQRHVMVSERWKALSEEDRSKYNKRRLILHDEWLKDLKSKINEETTESTSNDG